MAYNFQKDRGRINRGGEMEQYQASFGADYNVNEDWNARLYVNYSRNSLSSGGRELDRTALAQALADDDPSTALNVFGDGNDNNP